MITITLHLGTKTGMVQEVLLMMPTHDFGLFINDYRKKGINLLNLSRLRIFLKFKTGLKLLFEVLKNMADDRKLNGFNYKRRNLYKVGC